MVPRWRGFSLIELLAVLLIIALTASMGMITLRTQRGEATLQDVLGRLVDYDRAARLHAQRSGQGIELRYATGTVEQYAEASSEHPARMPLQLPDGYTIHDLWMGADRAGDQPIAVEVGRNGRSRSYGFRLAGPHNQSRWISVLGLSGQVQAAENNAQSDDILSLLALKRLNAP